MKRSKTIKIIQKFEPLSDDFHIKLTDLEIKLEKGIMTHDQLKELFELYSTASGHYEALEKTEEFNFYIKKMHDLIHNPKISCLLKRRDSKNLAEKIEITVKEKKEKVEKIKTLIKEKNVSTNLKSETTNVIDDFKKHQNENMDEEIISKDIASQEESFKKRLIEKKLTRNNSQPRMNFKSNFKLKNLNENTIAKEKINEEKEQIKDIEVKVASEKRRDSKKSVSPVRRSSRFSINEEQNEKNHSKTDETKLSKESIDEFKEGEVSNFEEVDEITKKLNFIYDTAEKRMEEELDKIQKEIELLIEHLTEEKFQKMIEINQKYELELKDLEADVDFDDETNVNTMIYNDLIADREKEKKDYLEELDKRKKKGIKNIKQKNMEMKDRTFRMFEIERMKEDLTKTVMEKILNSMAPSFRGKSKKNKLYKMLDDDEEERDVIKEDDIKINRKLTKSVTEKGFIKRSFPKRVSKGDISEFKIAQGEKNEFS